MWLVGSLTEQELLPLPGRTAALELQTPWGTSFFCPAEDFGAGSRQGPAVPGELLGLVGAQGQPLEVRVEAQGHAGVADGQGLPLARGCSPSPSLSSLPGPVSQVSQVF